MILYVGPRLQGFNIMVHDNPSRVFRVKTADLMKPTCYHTPNRMNSPSKAGGGDAALTAYTSGKD